MQSAIKLKFISQPFHIAGSWKGLLLSFAALLTAIANSFGQLPSPVQDNINRNAPNPVPKSPNVASLGKFGDYQVSHFSGLPEISIPLFEVKSGSISIPITLSYHASGVKPTDVASWVGLGWALSTGGQVSRSIRGKADEDSFRQNALRLGTLPVCGPTGTGAYNYLNDIVTGIKDTDPDIFDYSFPGGSGKFLLPYGESPYLIPAAPVSINPFVLDKFEITDQNGVLYRYGVGANTMESTYSQNGGGSVSGATAWHLTEIIAPNSDDQVSYVYQDVGTVVTNDLCYSQSIVDQCFSTALAGTNPPCPGPFPPQQINVSSNGSQRGVKTIFFENGKVEFNLAPANRLDATSLKALKTIQVFALINGQYVLTKTVEFRFSYFTDASTANSKLKLDGVFVYDGSGSPFAEQKYKFTYFTNSFSWNPASNVLLKRDLWGYYNGASNTDLILPTTIDYQETVSSPPSTYSFGGAFDRNVNTQYVKEGVLSRIDFPTGGYTEFDYESHKYLENSVQKLAGGLRVTQIKSYAGGSALPVVKTYKYGNAESGIGTANFNMNQFKYNTTQMYFTDCDPNSTPVIQRYRTRTYYSNSALALNPFDSSPVFYNYVTEYTGDPTGNILGKTVYEYDGGIAVPDGVDLIVPSSGKYYRPSYGWKRGKLTKKTVYGKTGTLISKSRIGYTVYKAVNGKQIGIGAHQFITGNLVCSSSAGGMCLNEAGATVNMNTFFSTAFTQDTGVLLESSSIDSLFDTSNAARVFVTKTTKTYENTYTLPKLTTTELSGNSQQSITSYSYPFELTANASSTGAAEGVYLLNQKHILSAPIETYSWMQKSDGTNQRIVSAQRTTYKKNAANNLQVVPDQVFLFESSLAVAKASYPDVAVNGTNNGLTTNAYLKPRINLSTYDADGNLLALTKVGDISTGYLYGYDNTLPTIQVNNADNTEVLIQNFEDATGASVFVDANAAHSGLKYWNGNYAVTFSLPNARAYVIDYWYRDTNNKWQYNAKAYTGSTTLTDGSAFDDVRIYPKDAQVSSFTYHPLYGKTSESDTNGRTTYYEYDAFGRLKLIRDSDKNVVKAYDYHYVVQDQVPSQY